MTSLFPHDKEEKRQLTAVWLYFLFGGDSALFNISAIMNGSAFNELLRFKSPHKKHRQAAKRYAKLLGDTATSNSCSRKEQTKRESRKPYRVGKDQNLNNMKKIVRYYLLSFFVPIFMTTAAFCLPDLTLTSISNTPVNLGLGQVITITMNVQNIGTSNAAHCHIALYLSSTPTFTNAVYLSQISLEALPAGASSNGIQFVYPVPYNVSSGTNYVLVSIDDLNEVSESDETNNDFYSNTTINVSGVAGTQKLPYPMIFIHGLIGCNQTWDSLLVTYQNWYGWSFGGNMKFCLNQDGDFYNAILPSDYHDYTIQSNLAPADFYTVNFDVDHFGNSYFGGGSSDPDESNQAAIVKQGIAIKDAIAHVLQVSGRDKVILVGHSMGGLAAREYLQNSSIWQPDGQNHVAKLFTVGTPNGGSNSTSFGLGLGSIDEQSDAVRDLRYSYAISGDAGVYLFGGLESLTVMNNSLVWDYYNPDVNCNGISSQNITGLNFKSIPSNISYSCIIGTGSLLGGDGVVDEPRADLNNYPGTIYADTFMLDEPSPCIGCTWHQQLPKQVGGNVQGIDEANEYNQSYDVSPNQLYFGLITTQSIGGPYVTDYDDFKINMASGNLNIKVYNIPISQYGIDILNSSFNSVYSIFSNGKSYVNTNTTLSAGQYYFELSGTPTSDSWFYPYAFKLSYTSTTDIEEIAAENNFHSFNYPNPFQSTTTISFTLAKSDLVIINVYNLYGQLISTLSNETMSEGKHEIQFDGSDLASGVYVYTIQSGNNIETYKLTISK